eukprot:3289385-Amphidinium_carterae.1
MLPPSDCVSLLWVVFPVLTHDVPCLKKLKRNPVRCIYLLRCWRRWLHDLVGPGSKVESKVTVGTEGTTLVYWLQKMRREECIQRAVMSSPPST